MGEEQVDFVMTTDNLYREESYTDLKVGAIRCLIPVNVDGTEDTSREKIFVGHSQLMTPKGVMPIQATLEASTLDGAISAFPAAMSREMEKMIQEAKKMHEQQMKAQQEAESSIIMPGR